MNDREHELFEAELRRLQPAKPPEELMTRFAAVLPVRSQRTEARALPAQPPEIWWVWLRWLAPGLAAAVAVVVMLMPWTKQPSRLAAVNASPAPGTNNVEIDRQLVAAFDTVAQMPNGEPVRFRCREWVENVVLRDPAQGVVVEHRTPRFEMVPIGFEIY